PAPPPAAAPPVRPARPLTPPAGVTTVPASPLSRPAPPVAPVAAGVSAPARPVVFAPRPTGAPGPAAPSAPPRPASPTPGRAPINPFLANDPNAKARRLARALVSDLVTYFPQRRDEGLRDGTLKDLFREEIKKSYEEFVEQVGREFADSTQHFQDALNEILAKGQKVF